MANVTIHMLRYHCLFTARFASSGAVVVSFVAPEAGTGCTMPRVWQTVDVSFFCS